MGRLFGTDGVRGVANTELTCQLAFKLGQAGAYVLAKNKGGKPKILVGQDTRISGDMLEAALVAGICSTGATAIRLGVVPTPAVAYLTRESKADAGAVISASHNTFEFNGIKFFNSQGYKLNDEIEEQIEEIILDRKDELEVPEGAGVGVSEIMLRAVEKYVTFACSTVEGRFDGFRVALDCANGASYETAAMAFRQLGADVHVIHNQPDGVNINEACGSTHMESLMAFVKEHNCHIGFAFDGDADRMLAVDHTGAMVDGDVIMGICALEMKRRGTLKNNTLVATVMSNLGLFSMGNKNGIHVEKTKVGDRYVLENMLEGGHVIGGEQSGHVIFLEHNTTGDGLISALQLMQVVRDSEKPLAELKTQIQIFPQALVNAKVKNEFKRKYKEDAEIMAEIARLEEKYGEEGRVLIRPSGTEPKIRVMIEGQNQAEIEADAQSLASLIEKRAENSI